MNSDHVPFTMAGGNKRTPAPTVDAVSWRMVAWLVFGCLAVPVGSYLIGRFA